MKSAPDGIEIIERSIHLLRSQPARVWVVQLAGTVPLLLSILSFLLNLDSENAFKRQAIWGSLICAVCLIWFNICRSRFAQHLLSSLFEDTRGSWKVAMSPVPLLLQSAKLFLLPLAMTAIIPWARAVAFFRTVPLVNGPGSLARAKRLSAIWPHQNWLALGLLILLAIVVFVNMAICIVMLPQLVRTFTGIQNEFTRPTGNPINNVTLSIALALTWFALDPLYQAIYAVRFFLGEARGTGADLRVAIRRLALPVFLLVTLLVPWGRASAAGEPIVTGTELRRGVKASLASPAYDWYHEVEKPVTANFFTRTAQGVRHQLGVLARNVGRFFDWLFRRQKPDADNAKKPSGLTAANWTLIVLCLALLVVTGLALVRMRFFRSAPATASGPTAIVTLAPDLESDSTTAADLPEERWLDLAHQCLARGEYRPALRAIYFANLSYLGRRELLTIGRFKSNLDYTRELHRRARNLDLNRAFRANVRSFERGWYGLHAVETAQISEFELTFAEIKVYAES